MAAHPAFAASVDRLRSWGVSVLYGDEVVELHPPGTGERFLDEFPWALAMDELERKKTAGLESPRVELEIVTGKK